MNTTFNKDDEIALQQTFNASEMDMNSPVRLNNPDVTIATSTPKEKTLNSTLVLSVEENNGNEAQKSAEPEYIAGCTRTDVIIMKHTTKQMTDIIKRLLESDEFEVKRCSDGTILSQGRVSNFGLPGQGNTVADEEYQRAIKERDQARLEAEKMHENYSSLYASFNAIREAASDIRAEYEDAAEKLKLAASEVEEWKTKFLAVKENANEELERASIEYDDLVKNHDENTKGLRLRVKRMEIELSGKNDEISNLKNRVNELSAICDQLIGDVDVCDSESRHSASYDA